MKNLVNECSRACQKIVLATVAFENHHQDEFELNIGIVKGLVHCMFKEIYDPLETQFISEAQLKVCRHRISVLMGLLEIFNNSSCSAITKFLAY